MTAIDCFAGCGGMTQGLKQAGFNVIGAIENNESAGEVYSLNHPNVHLWGDIRDVTTAEILKILKLEVGQLGLLGGCPPCQGFSTLRTYNGSRSVRDKQNDLIFEFQRLVLGLLPERVMLENVPGLKGDRRLEVFKEALTAAGYKLDDKILNAVYYGVPQRRRRLVLLASRVSSVVFATPDTKQRTVREAIGSLPLAGKSGDALHDLPEKRSDVMRKVIAAVPRNGGSRAALPAKFKLKCHRHFDGFRDVYGRMSWDKPAPTITTGCFNPSKGRFLHPTANRCITMREAALLQSFPKSYKFPPKVGKVKLSTMIGNALPPEFIKRHAKKLMEAGLGTSPGVTASNQMANAKA